MNQNEKASGDNGGFQKVGTENENLVKPTSNIYKNQADISLYVKEKVSGRSGEIRIDCPCCTGGQGETLGVNADTGAYHCFRCDVVGNFKSSKQKKAKKPLSVWIWDKGRQCSIHPYLELKRVKSYGLRCNIDDDMKPLLIPLYKDGKLVNVQSVYGTGDKRFLPKSEGAIKKGAYYTLKGDDSKVYVCEGYATAATVREISENTVIMGIDAGNLEHCIDEIRDKFSTSEIIIAADNDSHGKGLERAKRAAFKIGCQVCMPDQVGKDFNDIFLEYGPEAVIQQLSNFIKINSVETDQAWDICQEILPKTLFPWEIFPIEIAESLQALARSCASSPDPLPGVAFAMVASIVGRKLAVSPKMGWSEPLIFWFSNIRESGEGKTAPQWEMAEVLKIKQKNSHEEYDLQMEAWKSLPKKNRPEPPPRPRGFFGTEATIEGLREEMENHPTGGFIILLNEVSSIINSQNQYKGGKGTDRESWLGLHDGQPVRVIRANKTYYIDNARIQVVGGIQPAIFRRVFGGNNGQFLEDGTVFRFLFTYGPPTHHELTAVGWHDIYREDWNLVLKEAFKWSDTSSPIQAILSEQARGMFFDWRNELDREKFELPEFVRGFLPKAYGYALRFSGIIDAIWAFSEGMAPRRIIDEQIMECGIKAATFYLGQAIDAISILKDEPTTKDQISSRILEAIKDKPKTKTEIFRDVLGCNVSSENIKMALDDLIASKTITVEMEKTPGRSREIYSHFI